MGTWLGFGDNYQPDGFFSAADERAQQVALINPWLDATEVEYQTIAAHGDRGDEVYQPVSFAYIPTEEQIVQAVAYYNITANAGSLDTVGVQAGRNQPKLSQLVQSLYQSTMGLWRNLAASEDVAGW